MEYRKRPSMFITALFIAGVFAMIGIFVLFIIKVSLQSGEVSSIETNMLSQFMAGRILESPSGEQVTVVNRMLRYGAHLGLFCLLAYMLTYVSLIIFQGIWRIVGLGLVGAGCYMLSYYTEYYKQFVEGRHFEMADVRLNWIGCVFGILFMLFSYYTNKMIYRLEK